MSVNGTAALDKSDDSASAAVRLHAAGILVSELTLRYSARRHRLRSPVVEFTEAILAYQAAQR